MMKNFTLSILAATLSFSSFAQTCTPDASFVGSPPGIYPVTPLAPSCDLISAKTIISLTDTVVEVTDPFPVTILASIDAMRVIDVVGLPAGLTFETDVMASVDVDSPFGIWYNSGTVPNQTSAIGCAFVYGTGGEWDNLINGGPNNDGIYPISFVVDARVAETDPNVSTFLPNGTWMSDPAYSDLTGGAFIIEQSIIVLPGYDTISAVVTGETNPVPFTGENYSVGANPDVTYNWTVTNGTITGGQGTNAVTVEWDGSTTGNIQVELTDGGCYGISDLDITANTVGIANANLNNLKVWPNPSAGIFEIAGLDAASTIEVMDLSGRTLFRDQINVDSKIILDLSDNQSGVYLLRVTTNGGTTTKRIIKN